MIRIITAELKNDYCLGSIYDQLNQNLWGKGEAFEYFCKALQETVVCKLDEEPLCSNQIEVKIHTIENAVQANRETEHIRGRRWQ